MCGFERVPEAAGGARGIGVQNNRVRGVGRKARRAGAAVCLLAGAASFAGQAQSPGTGTWQPVGPDAVATPGYGLVSGRVTAVAFDPADATGNHVYVGTTGGGVWAAQNAATASTGQIVFSPLTDAVGALNGATDGSISIGALGVQPGGTGVVLAGTGDPNDALDSYYGAGILRSGDGGSTWTLIATTADGKYQFAGEAFAGFAWSTVNPQVVVAAVAQAYEGTLVNAVIAGHSYEGLYYSSDGGVTWSLATISDGAGQDVQGPLDAFALPDGNAATSVEWNPVRQLFMAAVRYHGYYQSTDGVTWTRMAAQPGAGLGQAACPTNGGRVGSIDCPVFRGSLAVNPLTGDTFAWTVDAYNQDQGLWQDACAIANGACTNLTVTFARQWNTQAMETNTLNGPATILNGDYDLALAAVPYALQQGADTWLLAGANDLWRCSLAQGCVWRNTTNAFTCRSGEVAPYEHALGWNAGNPLEILVGNDGGLWRSLDAIGETGAVCNGSDAAHFENLNGGLGSLAEVEWLARGGISPYTMMTGLGVNGTAGLKSASAPAAEWPQILGGFGGPVAIDPNATANWYVNNQDGVSIYLCTDPMECTPADFGTTPVVTDADVGGDGYGMSSPAAFVVDAVASTQLLIATCRVWRGPASGVGWTGANAISPVLDSGAAGVACSGDALIRSIAAQQVGANQEVVYVGMFGLLNGGAGLPGHVLKATVNTQAGAMPAWQDLTVSPVSNSPYTFNQQELDVSSIFIDPHDATGNTVYVTVEGVSTRTAPVETVYGSTDGGAHWASVTANLPAGPASSAVVDPRSAATVYVATDAGVYFTTAIQSCAGSGSSCWSAFGTGLPEAPVVALSASPASAAAQVLTAATYGRGVWQTGLWSAGASLTTATALPRTLTFGGQAFGTVSSAQPVVLTNTGMLPLTPTGIAMTGDFSETDNCLGQTIAVAGTCMVEVTFAPTATGSRNGQMTVSANVYGGQLTVALSGTGTAAGVVTLTPPTLSFDAGPGRTSASPPVAVGATSGLFQVEAGNSGAAAIPITSLSITPPFAIASNACGTTQLVAGADCQIQLTFTPTAEGAVAGTLTMVDGAGTQTVLLSGFGYAAATDQLNPTALLFPATAVNQVSAALPVLVTNTGDLPLNGITVAATGPFEISSTCGGQLAAHAACTVSVEFAPTALGSASGALTFTDAMRVQTVTLSGSGAQAAALGVSPASLNFSGQTTGVASAPQTLTITNNGGVAAANVGFQITGAAAASFATAATSCGPQLAAGASCTVQVIFTAAAAGASAAALIVSSSTAGVAAVSVPLNGAALATSGLNVTPPQLTFAETLVGAMSAAQTVTVSNTSAVAASQLTIAPSAGFAVVENNCPAALAGGANCSVGVEFAPVAVGPVVGSLIVTSSAIANTAAVQLRGTGAVASAIQVVPGNLGFATTGVGQTSNVSTVTVTNTGAVTALSGLGMTVSAGFALVNNTCAATLGPGSSCTAGIEFMPTAAGAQTGTLTVASATVAASVVVPLSGTGFDFTVAVMGAGTQSVSQGASAGYTLLITPLGGGSGSFTFACDALPTNALCVFSPPSETINGGGSGNVAVAVSTGSASALAMPLRVLPLVCVGLLLPVGWKRRRRGLLLALFLGLVMGGVTSCAGSGGGGGGGTGGSGGGSGYTPDGTYSIPVTVTANGVSHSATVTLTVD